MSEEQVLTLQDHIGKISASVPLMGKKGDDELFMIYGISKVDQDDFQLGIFAEASTNLQHACIMSYLIENPRVLMKVMKSILKLAQEISYEGNS